MTAPEQPYDDESLTLDDIRGELSDVGRALLDQAVASAQRVKRLRAELARTQNASAPTTPRTADATSG